MKKQIINKDDNFNKIKEYKPICFSVSAASSWVALGMIPGSLKLVRKSVDITNKNKTAATAGMAGLIW